jgi:iron complex outermembrane receptor protein
MLRSVCAAAVVGVPMSAAAQNAAPAPTETERDTRSDQDIVVTALKRSENLQDIPAAISAIGGAELQQRGIVNIQSIGQVVPNVDFGEHTGTALISIRGVGSVVDSGVTEPTVATYVDGVFLPRATMGFVRAVDLDRIEVLRGPQGTLYGRNATGGAINFISKAPTADLRAGVNLSTGSRNAFGISGYVSGPLAKGIRFRVSGGHEEEDGYVRWLPNKGAIANTNVDYVRGALQLEPTSNLTIDLAARYEKSTGANAVQQLFTPTIIPTPGQSTRPFEIYGDGPFAARYETFIASGTMNWEISDAISLKSVTSYVDHKSVVSFDADATDVGFYNAINFSRPSESFGQELSLVGDSGALQWIVGAFYFHENAGNVLPLGIGGALAPASGVPTDTQVTQGLDTKVDSIAAFVDGTYSITDVFKVNLGLRFNHEEKKFLQNVFLRFPDSSVLPIVTDVPNGIKSDRFLPKVNLQYDLSDNVNAYVQWSKGFKSGGMNLPGGAGEYVGDVGLYRPETIDAFEIGLKTQSSDRRITANFAAFYYDYRDLQVTISRGVNVTLVQNAPATVYGIEGEVRFRVSNAFTLNAAGSWLHARFEDFESFDDARPQLGLINLKGDQLPHAPDFSGTLGAEYRADLGDGLLSSLALRGDVSYKDRIVLRYFGTPNDSQNAYALVNLSATITDADEKTRLRVFVNNLTDKAYRQNATYLATGAYYGNYGPPRTWGVQLSRDF